MGAKRPGADSTYDAARQWVDRALRTDDSLFTPETPIWTRQWLGELHTRFLEQPAVSRVSDFLVKLEQQLAGCPPEVYQLMAETLYVHYLIQHQTPATKRRKIEPVLGWSPNTVPFPEHLIGGLQGRLINAEGGFGSKRISYQVGTFIESVVHWKKLESAERERLLQAPWAFKEFLFTRRFTSSLLVNNQNTGGLERHLLLHIVHPDSFEAMLGNDKKRLAKARAFQRCVPERNLDTDRAIKHIREGLEAKFTKRIGFYNDDIRKYWKPNRGEPVAEEMECGDPPPPPPPPPPSQYTIDDIIEEGCFLERSKLETILAHLRLKKNLILQGPPGTGKTWLAKKLAFALIGQKDGRRVRRLQFHPNLSYEDFIRGFRPGGDGTLTLIDGPLLEVANDAKADSNNDYAMVIEEINRGNPAQIFGETLTLMEADKRSEEDALALAYPRSEGERVHLPPNLYIIGTMNVADRSIAMVDLALRRRFAFVDLEPVFGAVWRNWVSEQCGIPSDVLERIEARMTSLNEQIASDPNLGPQFRVGHSVVTPAPGTTTHNPVEWFRQVVETEVGPLLDEYWFDDAEKAENAKAALLAEV